MDKITSKATELIKLLVGDDKIAAVKNFTTSNTLNNNDVDLIASMLGYHIDVPFSKMCEDKKNRLITSFKRNLSLLIQKTWIEETDSALKDEVLYKLDTLKMSPDIDWVASYDKFLDIIHKAIFLMFGEQFQTPDFCEYALRIDGTFGVFWWYIISLPKKPAWEADKCHIAVLLGMYFLANY